jgi:sugar lactone lactonase YvrE
VSVGPALGFLLAWGNQGNGEGQFVNPSDLVVDSQGNVYVNDWGRADVQKFDANGTYVATIGGPGTGEGEFSDDALARMGIGSDDTLYVPDDSQVEVFAPDGTFLRSFGNGNLGFAVDAAVDAEGNVFVSDGEKNQVQIYDPDGTLVGSWGAFGTEPGNFIETDALALDGSGNIYVVDFGNQRVQKFALTLPAVNASEPAASPVASSEMATFLWETTRADIGMGWPSTVTIAPDGTIWLCDAEHSRFHLFAPDGAFIETWGTPGTGDGEFNFARSNDVGDAYGALAFAPDGSVYVADMGNFRIQHFSADRQFLSAWGAFGPGDGEFLSPLDIAVDSQGNVFVDDEQREVIQKFDANGTHLLTFGGSGSEPGQLAEQGWMTIDANDHVWVADTGNGRIQQFDNNGQFLAEFDGGGALVEPWDVAVDAAGRLFVADLAAGQVVVLDAADAVIGVWGQSGGPNLRTR